MKKINLLIAAVLVAGAASAQTWTLDKAHSKLGFTVNHLVISEVEGAFKSFDISLTASKEDFSDAVIKVTADINTVNTDNDDRDKHLKSPDFFDAAKFGTLTFEGTSFTKVDGKKYKLAGNLTLHGVTKPVELEVIFNGTTTHPFNKKTVAAFKVSGKINRKDFTVGTIPAAVVSEEVYIHGSAELTKN